LNYDIHNKKYRFLKYYKIFYKTAVTIENTDEENVKYLERLIEALDDCDDVQEVYHNWDEPEEEEEE
jgi:transcriptional/translational regulatory protein YebC/TACO1